MSAPEFNQVESQPKMRIRGKFFSVASATVSLALLVPAVAMADPGGTLPPPSGPAYVCDRFMAVPPGVFGYANCEAFGGMPANNFFKDDESYELRIRNGDLAGKVQQFQCSGGYVDAPTSVAPKRCHPVTGLTPASAAPKQAPYGGPGGPGHK